MDFIEIIEKCITNKMSNLNTLLSRITPESLQKPSPDFEELIKYLESINNGETIVNKEDIEKIMQIKSTSLHFLNFLNIKANEKSYYALALMEEIAYRKPNSPAYKSSPNLLSAASLYTQAKEYVKALNLLEAENLEDISPDEIEELKKYIIDKQNARKI